MENKRKVIVELETADGRLARFDGLNVKFNVKKTACAVMNKATIDIANLSMDRIYELTTFLSPYMHIGKRKRIFLYAGYVKNDSDSPPLIYKGEITKAMPSEPPDVWLKCEARTGYFNNQKVVSLGFNGKLSVKELCGKIAESLKVALNFTATSNKSLDGFTHNGGATDAIGKLNDLGGVVAFEDDGELTVMDAVNPGSNAGGYMRVINRQSGMIGLPQVDHMGVKVKMLLDPAFKVGSRIRVESDMMRKINGEYWSYAITHSGELRGKEFYTEIEARRTDILL